MAASIEHVRARTSALAAAAAALPLAFRPAARELVVDEALAARLAAESAPPGTSV